MAFLLRLLVSFAVAGIGIALLKAFDTYDFESWIAGCFAGLFSAVVFAAIDRRFA